MSEPRLEQSAGNEEQKETRKRNLIPLLVELTGVRPSLVEEKLRSLQNEYDIEDLEARVRHAQTAIAENENRNQETKHLLSKYIGLRVEARDNEIPHWKNMVRK